MKIKSFIITLILCMGLGLASVNVTSCSAGAHIGPVGAGASVR
ncbi:hypothetical protein BH10PSE19_BH10PSE19_05930 [soil metagenome]